MDGSQPFDACAVDALHGTYPQLQVGVDGVLHQHGDIHSLQGIGHLLYGKGVGRGAGTYPQNVYSSLQAFVHMLGGSHFGGHVHAGLLLDLLQPGESLYTDTFEAAWFGARLPDAGAEYLQSFLCQ